MVSSTMRQEPRIARELSFKGGGRTAKKSGATTPKCRSRLPKAKAFLPPLNSVPKSGCQTYLGLEVLSAPGWSIPKISEQAHKQPEGALEASTPPKKKRSFPA